MPEIKPFCHIILKVRFKVLNSAVAIALVSTGTAACGQKRLDLPQAADKNVLIVTIDTLRGDALGCYGGPARTPNIDRAAAEGIRFAFAHAQTVVTLAAGTTLDASVHLDENVRDVINELEGILSDDLRRTSSMLGDALNLNAVVPPRPTPRQAGRRNQNVTSADAN